MIHPISGQRTANNPPAGDDPLEEPAAPVLLWDGVTSLAASTLFHAALLLILALFIFQGDETPLIDVLDATMPPEPVPEAITLSQIEIVQGMNADARQSSSEALDDVRELANASDPPPVIVTTASVRGLVPSKRPGDANGFGGEALAGLGESSGLGDFQGDAGEEVAEGEVGFFGAKDKGKSFVFIVDCSLSMTRATAAYRSQNGVVSRFERAREELGQSLGHLSPEQTYYVIFYNHETYPMYFPLPAPGMVPASGEHLMLTRNWIDNISPGGGTDPRQAFQLALALRPDVIFFLTDGAIPPATRNVARENNKSRTRIHTIAFGIPDPLGVLKGIARDNQGRFRFVP